MSLGRAGLIGLIGRGRAELRKRHPARGPFSKLGLEIEDARIDGTA